MAWGQQQQPPPAAGPPGGDAAGGRFAVPAACPRCELTKSQMNRTIQNYQKAYRKKVEGLKTELATVRADNGQLKQQVKRLRRKQWTHLPSMALGAALAAAVAVLRRKWQQKQQEKDSTAAAAAASDT